MRGMLASARGHYRFPRSVLSPQRAGEAYNIICNPKQQNWKKHLKINADQVPNIRCKNPILDTSTTSEA